MYYVAVHKRSKRRSLGVDRWRYRQHDNGQCKVDPAWESGSYLTCHDLPEKLSADDWVFDVVFPQSGTDLAVVRSAFQIESIEEGVASFSNYFFLDESWNEGIPLTPRRGEHELDEKRGGEWVSLIEGLDSYSKYSAGEKPASVSKKGWLEMTQALQVCRRTTSSV